MLISIAQLIGGFILLVWGADRLVAGASALARNLGVSPLIIGLTIVAFGTSAPELVVSAVAAYRGNAGLAVGNAIGSNIANVGLILGLTELRNQVVQEERHGELVRRIEDLERRIKSAKRYAGVVRFDAFDDIGGEQSFALAIYDEEGNGAIVTSLVGRDSCRVFCKKLAGGDAEQELSTEERKAIEAAVGPMSGSGGT